MDVEKRQRGWLKGSYTVEASVAVPVLLGLILISILAAFFLHDKAVIQAATIGRAFGFEDEGINLFLLEDMQLSGEKGDKRAAWSTRAYYKGMSAPLFQLVWKAGYVEENWTGLGTTMPDFIRLMGLWEHMKGKES